ncbi:MAG TPA: protein kinase [Thermoanaerobaculia bacterium]|nr:protein kinase [Thermoanaerobaculia bacterium]
MESLVGQNLSHYLIERRLGAGGMGEVFLARDLALGRPAAVKVLAQPLSSPFRARLLREAEACARLQHPAIATFYEAGEVDGVVFLAMEFVAGETLRERLLRGPLPVPEALLAAGCLLEALNHAHAAGVLHRDIKPENVMLTSDGLAKLLDFGIARLVSGPETGSETPTDVALTEVGAIVGTLGYMSPEQLKSQPLDERSDLFSLGAVLYETLSGHPAFPGNTAAERIAAILADEPQPLRTSGVPPEIDAVISRALARDRERRYPTAAALLADLRAAASGELVVTLPDTLAVIDFENLSRNPEDDWLGSGIAESLATDLSRLPGLSVVAREKLLEVRGSLGAVERGFEALAIGRLLPCRWVLTGAYQRVGPRLRVTSRLTEVATGETVGSEKIDGAVADVFRVQDQLSAAAAQTLRPGGAPLAPLPTSRIDAYERHARGRRLFLHLEKGSMDQARLFYEQAIGADPQHAPSLAGLAAVHAMRFTFMTDPRELEASIGYARRAISADPNLAEPRIWLGYSLLRQGKIEEAVEQERKAMELDPSAVFAPYFGACALGLPGRYAEALPFFQRALEIEPRHGWAWLGLGWTHLELGSGSEARWCLEKAVGLERLQSPHPTAGVSGYLGECLRRLGDPEGGRARCLEGLEAVERSDNMYRDTFRAVCLCALGRCALEQNDQPAARTAFAQAEAHLRGRPRGLGGGYLLVQALAGRTRAGEGGKPFGEAVELYRSRGGHDFSFMWLCTDGVTLLELARAAAALGRSADAQDFFRQAQAAGSREALAPAAPASG